MEIISEMAIGKERSSGAGFHLVEGIIFCESCGKSYKEKDVNGKCFLCNDENFISGIFAATLAGYLELDRKGVIKKYYSTKYRKDSIVKMNNTRIIIRLLIMDRLIDSDDKNMEVVIMKVINSSKKNMRNYR